MFNILFPMAGEGSRFGYQFKPFLQISDQTFIQLAFKYFANYREYLDTIYFVVTKEQYESYQVKEKLGTFFQGYKYTIIQLPQKTNSQYETLIQSITQGNITGNCFVCDCDHSIDIAPVVKLILDKAINMKNHKTRITFNFSLFNFYLTLFILLNNNLKKKD